MMHLDHIFCDRKSQSCTANFPGTCLVHTEKALKNMVHTVLRDTNAGVCHFNIKILMVCIQCYTDPAGVYIILDGIFHQIGHSQV